MARIKITQVRSVLSRGAKQRGTMRALGIRGIGDSAVHEDRPEVRGMIRAVAHLVRIEPDEDET